MWLSPTMMGIDVDVSGSIGATMQKCGKNTAMGCEQGTNMN
jgi:hypothetical protein